LYYMSECRMFLYEDHQRSNGALKVVSAVMAYPAITAGVQRFRISHAGMCVLSSGQLVCLKTEMRPKPVAKYRETSQYSLITRSARSAN
jgi:hypothetical protein